MKPFILFFLLALATTLYAQDTLAFREANGIVIIEAESAATIPGAWTKDTSVAGFTGSSSLRYTGGDLFNTVGRNILSYKVFISEVGRYRFRWRSRIAIGDSNTEHNDSWLRLPDASDFYAQEGQRIVYPKGSGRTPNPEGSGAAGWFKVYQNNLGNWTFNARTSDNDPHLIYAEFDTVGVYTIQVASRSNGHSIDRLVLYHVADANAAIATDPNTPESSRMMIPTSLRARAQVEELALFPNPAREVVNVPVPAGSRAGIHELKLFNNAGQEIRSIERSIVPGETLSVPVAELPTGLYLLQFSDGEKRYLGRFLRE